MGTDSENLGYEVASWSSSGVFRPIEVFWAFDEAIYK
jgi:hypothetical protein